MALWRAKLKGMFMLFRILAVLVWACTAGTVATAAAVLDGQAVELSVFAFVLLMAALVQGYPAHIINEIYDWQSGSDRPLDLPGERRTGSRDARRPAAGGSKVLAAGLLTIPELWCLFHVTTACVIGLTVFAGLERSTALLWFIIPGYFLCIFYTLPPFRFAYRPFAGEYLGGFAGIVLLVTGAYYAQSLTLPRAIVMLACGLGFHYAAIMVFFHYVDYSRDRLATPPKRTSVVQLGLEGSRRYALINTAIGTLLLLVLAVTRHPDYAWLVAQGALIFYCHLRVDPANDRSIVFWGKRMTYGVLVAGVAFAMIADRVFVLMIGLYALGFWLHQRFGKLRPAAALQQI